ncbi:MAG: TIGR03089 family protein [Dermatophilaceae bacterium]
MSIRDILQGLSRDDATTPRLTWYGRDGERVELSARVLDNWVNKAANLLIDEADSQPGDSVGIDLPPGHWRAAYWALAAWSCGATVRLDDGADVDTLVTADPGRVATSRAGVRILVALPALARSAYADVPSGVIDEAAELATYADQFPRHVTSGSSESAVALVGPDGVSWNVGSLTDPDQVEGARRHVDAARLDAAAALRAMLAAWSTRGSVVVTSAGSLDTLERTLATEGVDWTD